MVFLGLEGHCLSVYELKNVSLSSVSSLLKKIPPLIHNQVVSTLN